MVFFQKWPHRFFNMIAHERASESMIKAGKLDFDLVNQTADKIADEMCASIANSIELLGKFNVELFKLGKLDSMSITSDGVHDLDKCIDDSNQNEYNPVLIVTIKTGSTNCLWLGIRGAYMLLNGLTKNQMSDIELDDDNTDQFVSDLAKQFCCVIEYETQHELSYASREVFMFDGSKVFEEETEFKWIGEDKNIEVVPENPDFKKKSFEDIIKENIAKAIINLELKTE